MEQEYSVLGSLFRRYTVLIFDVNDSPAFKLSGSRTTFFAAQAERYADLYASNCCNLINYPIFYFFRAPMTLMYEIYLLYMILYRVEQNVKYIIMILSSL